jgi:hypothetical protein
LESIKFLIKSFEEALSNLLYEFLQFQVPLLSLAITKVLLLIKLLNYDTYDLFIRPLPFPTIAQPPSHKFQSWPSKDKMKQGIV